MNFVAIALATIAIGAAPAAVQADVAPASPAPNAPAVPAAANVRVQVLGRVQKPGHITLAAGARLSDALTASGAYAIERLVARLGGEPVPDTECVLGGADLRLVYLTRTGDDSRRIAFAIDVARARQQHDLRCDPVLKDDDKIFVPECRNLLKPRFPIPVS